nr:MAG TPA: hypothetical protein [Caudoviricetes sp.]
MKLIDLLVQELPKRGGWPEGVDSIHQDHDGEIYAWSGSSAKFLFRTGIIADNCRPYGLDESIENMVTRNQYKSVLALSQKQSWNGEGLPPVGCEVEYISNGSSWGKVKVIGLDGEKVVIRPSGEIYYAITPSNKDVFIPLRTEADKKRDAALDAIYGAIASAKREHNRSDEADEVYKAIAAGKIPGVKLDD